MACWFATHNCLRLVLMIVIFNSSMGYSQDVVDDPYSKTFDDFQWNENEQRLPIAGAVPIGEPIDLGAMINSLELRTGANKKDCLGLTLLGQLYHQRAKADDDWSSYEQAAAVLAEALKIQPNYAGAKLHLAEVFTAQHKFHEAKQLASEVLEQKPYFDLALAILADCQLELGNYDEARESLDRLQKQEPSPPVLARLARLHEVTGDVPTSISLLNNAIAELDSLGASPEEVSWYQWRLGCLLFGQGKVAEAKARFDAVLKIVPDDAAALSSLAEAFAATGDYDRAIGCAKKIVDRYQAPPAMAMLGDLHACQGDGDKASDWYKKAEQAMRAEQVTAGDAHARELALFLANNSFSSAEAVALARKDLLRRQDVFAFDTLAWCLYRDGQFAEAGENINKSIGVGIKDATIYHHASLIFAALGNDEKNRHFADLATTLNPHFSILHGCEPTGAEH